MSDDKEPKRDDSFRYVGLMMFFLGMVMIATHPSSFHASPPRPKITSIPTNDPAVVAFKQFAELHKFKWYIRPDGIDGTDYCAAVDTANQSPEPFFFANACDVTIKKATDNVVSQYNMRNVKVGSNL